MPSRNIHKRSKTSRKHGNHKNIKHLTMVKQLKHRKKSVIKTKYVKHYANKYKSIKGGASASASANANGSSVYLGEKNQKLCKFAQELLDNKKQEPPPMDTKSIIVEFRKYLEATYTTEKKSDNQFVYRLDNKKDRYDICFLCAIMCILYDYVDKVNYVVEDEDEVGVGVGVGVEVKDNKIIRNANNDVKCCYDKKDKHINRLQYFMEDIYTDNLDLFLSEYDRFIESEYKSQFLFQSNIVNISLLLKCHKRRCFDKYFEEKRVAGYYYNRKKKNTVVKSVNFQNINTIFIKHSINLVKSLINAYESYKYTDICNLYLAYIDFYYYAFCETKYIRSDSERIVDRHFKQREYPKYKGMHSFLIMLNEIQSAITQSYDKHEYFIYISCIHISEHKQARFYMTKFIDSYFGGQPAHGDMFNSLDIIGHDLYLHGNLERTKVINENLHDEYNNYRSDMRTFIKTLLYETNEKVYEIFMSFLQLYQNEIQKKTPVNFNDKQKLCESIVVDLGHNYLNDTLLDDVEKHIHIQFLLDYLDINAYEIIEYRIRDGYKVINNTDVNGNIQIKYKIVRKTGTFV